MISAKEARDIVRSVVDQEKLIRQVVHDETLACDSIIRNAAEHGRTTVRYIVPSQYGIHKLCNSVRKMVRFEISKVLINRGFEIGPAEYDIQIYWFNNKEDDE